MIATPPNGAVRAGSSASTRAFMPRSILRSIAKSPNSIRATPNNAVAGWRQSYVARIRVSSRVPPEGVGVSRQLQVLSGLVHNSHRAGCSSAEGGAGVRWSCADELVGPGRELHRHTCQRVKSGVTGSEGLHELEERQRSLRHAVSLANVQHDG
jgi:hypothetical protein